MHLKKSESDSLQYEAMKTQELSPEKSPLNQLALKLTALNPTNNTKTNQFQVSTAYQPPIRVNQIIKLTKNCYLKHWDTETKSQNKLDCYQALKRDYTLAEYRSTVRDTKQRQILTKYRLSDHSLAIEKGRHRQTWLPKEERLCGHCETGEVETEMHFLTHCEKYKNTRDIFFPKFCDLVPEFPKMCDTQKLSILLGEDKHTARLAGQYVETCHSLRDKP
ncbi:UNVERIFIED_CONTAM: hypothetical protein FKN15_020198 [Acipenser sinensis]